MYKSILLAIMLSNANPPDFSLTFHIQDKAEPILVLPIPKDDSFVDRAQALANQRKEAIAVCQNGKFLCVVNPNRR